MRFVFVLAAATLLFTVQAASAQSTGFTFGAYVGGSLPVGDYGDSDPNDADAAHAGTGISAGLDLYYPLNESGLAWWLTSVGVTTHPVADDVVLAGGGPPPSGASVGGFIHYPLFTGLRYDIPVGEQAAYLSAQVGAVMIKAPEVESTSLSIDSDFIPRFGFALGAGYQATHRAHVGIRWVPLGDVELDYERTAAGTTVALSDVQNISFVDIFVGFSVR